MNRSDSHDGRTENRFEDHGLGMGVSLDGAMRLLRLVGALVGLVTMIIGLVLAFRVFGLIYTALQAPDGIAGLLHKWMEILDAERLTIRFGKEGFIAGKVVVILLLGGGAVVLAWIAMGIMLAGAKIVSLTSGDLQAIKRILKHTFGSATPVRKRTDAQPSGPGHDRDADASLPGS